MPEWLLLPPRPAPLRHRPLQAWRCRCGLRRAQEPSSRGDPRVSGRRRAELDSCSPPTLHCRRARPEGLTVVRASAGSGGASPGPTPFPRDPAITLSGTGLEAAPRPLARPLPAVLAGEVPTSRPRGNPLGLGTLLTSGQSNPTSSTPKSFLSCKQCLA